MTIIHTEELIAISDWWGLWFHDTRTDTLVHAPSDYAIPLRTIHVQCDVERWVRQISEKRFLSAADICNARVALMAIMEPCR